MTRTKILSGAYGGVIVAFGIWLDIHGYERGSQVFVLTALAIPTPIAFGLMVKGLRQRWFWIALVCCSLLHLLFLRSLQGKLPFSSLGAVILLGFAEILVFLLVTAKVMDSDPSGRATAEQFALARKLMGRIGTRR